MVALETFLIDFIQVAILTGQEAENDFKYHSTNRNVIFLLYTSRIFG